MHKVKLVAIAKDEGAYLPEWIFHHLHFGIDAIDIYINRTTDNSATILDRINEKYPAVNYFHADWVDLCEKEVKTRIQTLIYSKAFFEEQQKREFTHILFLDIDEFFATLDFEDIKSILSEKACHNSISFQWFNTIGDESNFLPFSYKHHGEFRPQIKTLISLQSEIRLMRIHLPRFKSERSSSLMPDGSPLVPQSKNTQRIDLENTAENQPAVIVHRMLRSETEYLSSLYRGRPGQDECNPLKTNRNGFDRNPAGKESLTFPEEAFLSYKQARDLFFDSIDIAHELEMARKFIIDRSAMVVNAIAANDNEENRETFDNLFRGVEDSRVKKLLRSRKYQPLKRFFSKH